jgi:hypothetical protein
MSSQAPFAIYGRVKKNGVNQAGVSVTVQNVTKNQSSSIMTDATGFYALDLADIARYSLGYSNGDIIRSSCTIDGTYIYNQSTVDTALQGRELNLLLIIQEVTDSIGVSDFILRNKTFSIPDSIGISDQILANKTIMIGDQMSSSDQIFRHKPLVQLTDSISLSELVTVITGIILKEVNDSISLTDQAKVNKSLVIVADSISFLDTPLVHKILQVADSIGLSEIIAVIKPGVVKTKIFFMIGDIAIQLSGD